MNKSGIMVLLVSVLLSGCQRMEYLYTPPETSGGLVCISQCASQREFCQVVSSTAESQCQNAYSLMMNNYYACRRGGGGRNCQMPAICSPQSGGRCDESFRYCYTGCGGKVEARLLN